MSQTRITTETAQAIAAGMPPCPNCGGRNVRTSQAMRFEDRLVALFHYVPYRCRGCQQRFYSRPKPAASASPDIKTDQPQAG
jgi:hypothetical protein